MISASTINATEESDVSFSCGISDSQDNNPSGFIPDRGVWYVFTAPVEPINVIAMDNNITFAVLTGTCDYLECTNGLVDGPDDDIFDLQLVEGQDYFLFVENPGNNAGVFMVEACTASLSCNDTTVELDVNGEASISVTDVAMAACDQTGITLSQMDFTCADVGDVMVTVSQTGQTDCISTVTVEDNVPPVITTTPQTVVLSDSDGTATLTVADHVTARERAVR